MKKSEADRFMVHEEDISGPDGRSNGHASSVGGAEICAS